MNLKHTPLLYPLYKKMLTRHVYESCILSAVNVSAFSDIHGNPGICIVIASSA